MNLNYVKTNFEDHKLPFYWQISTNQLQLLYWLSVLNKELATLRIALCLSKSLLRIIDQNFCHVMVF